MSEIQEPRSGDATPSEHRPDALRSQVDTLREFVLSEVRFLEGSASTRGIAKLQEDEEHNVNDILERRGQQLSMLRNAVAELEAIQADPDSTEDQSRIKETIVVLENTLRPIQARYEELEAKYELNGAIAELRLDVTRLCGLDTADQEISGFRSALEGLHARIREQRRMLASATLLEEEERRVEAKLAEIMML